MKGYGVVRHRLGGHPAVFSGKWSHKDAGRYFRGGRTAGTIWAGSWGEI